MRKTTHTTIVGIMLIVIVSILFAIIGIKLFASKPSDQAPEPVPMQLDETENISDAAETDPECLDPDPAEVPEDSIQAALDFRPLDQKIDYECAVDDTGLLTVFADERNVVSCKAQFGSFADCPNAVVSYEDYITFCQNSGIDDTFDVPDCNYAVIACNAKDTDPVSDPDAYINFVHAYIGSTTVWHGNDHKTFDAAVNIVVEQTYYPTDAKQFVVAVPTTAEVGTPIRLFKGRKQLLFM